LRGIRANKGTGGTGTGERGPALLVAVCVILAIALATGGVVIAKTITGGSGNETLVGTEKADIISGGAGDDLIDGLGGNDALTGGPGYDLINGGAGNDTISARDDGPDTIDCGPGTDTATVDRSEDGVFDCETVVTP
jgi:Ca2+-binding RTX toxin-like protein